MFKKKTIAILFFLAACAAFVLSSCRQTEPLPFNVKGNPDAAIHIIEYMDYECPACAVGSQILKKYLEDNPGQIFLEMRYFPLNGHRFSFLAARYAECAGHQKKFWPFHDTLVARQSLWKRLFSAEPAFRQISKELSLDLDPLDACLADSRVTDKIIDMKREGKARGINQTPTYFINGKKIIGVKSLETELNNLLLNEKDPINN